MESTPVEERDWGDHPTADGPLPEFVDWILGATIALGGLLGVVGGSALTFLVDRDLIREAIEEESISVNVGTTELSEDEAVELTNAVVSWMGTGLLVTGLAMVAFAIAFVVVRHRAHRRFRGGTPVSSYGSHAVLGAVATGFLSFIPFSPALGGLLAGYLERGSSRRTVSVGTLAGLLPMLPVLTFLLFLLVGLVSGLLTIGQQGVAIVVAAMLFLSMMLVATIGAGLGALGGYLGGRFAEERATRD